MRSYFWVISFSCLLTLILVAATSRGGPAIAPATQSDILAVPVGRMHPQATPLGEVIEQLRKNTGREIIVNWKEFDRVHIDRNLPVTVDLSDQPLGAALTKLLDNIGGEYAQIDFSLDDNVITISTRAALADANTALYVFDIRKALVTYKTDEKRRAAVDRIVRRIEGIDPLSWKEYGGPGDITQLNGQLIITQTHENQQRIISELQDILPGLKPRDVYKGGAPSTQPSRRDQ